MKNIQKKRADNLGGNFKLLFVPINEIEGWPKRTANTLSINADIVLTSGWYVFDFIRQTLLGDEAEKKNENQSTYEHLIDGTINNVDEEVVLQLERMALLRFVVLRKTANGVFKLHGSPKQPLQFNWKHSSKARPSELSAIDFKFYGTTTKQSLFYKGAVTEHVD